MLVRPGPPRVPGGGDDHHRRGRRRPGAPPDRAARRAVADRHADDLGTMNTAYLESVRQRLLDAACIFRCVLAVVRVSAIGDHPDRQDPRTAGAVPVTPLRPPLWPCPAIQQRHPGAMHAPVLAGRADGSRRVVGAGDHRPGQVADVRVQRVEVARAWLPAPRVTDQAAWALQACSHPLLFALISAGAAAGQGRWPARPGRPGGHGGQGRFRGATPRSASRHPPGQRGGAGAAASVCATDRATPRPYWRPFLRRSTVRFTGTAGCRRTRRRT